MSDFTQTYQNMIKVHGWTGTAATLGMKKSSLEARVYEITGHGMRVDTAMLIQRHSGTTLFAEAVASSSGGVFVPMPEPGPLGRADLMEKMMELHEEMGELSSAYKAAVADGEIDSRERAQLKAIENRMHRTIVEYMSTMFQVHCRQVPAEDEAE